MESVLNFKAVLQVKDEKDQGTLTRAQYMLDEVLARLGAACKCNAMGMSLRFPIGS